MSEGKIALHSISDSWQRKRERNPQARVQYATSKILPSLLGSQDDPRQRKDRDFRRQDRPRQRRRREREIKQGCEREHARSRGRPTIYDDFQGWCGATARGATGIKRHNLKPYCPSSSQMLTSRTGTLRCSSFGEEAPSFPFTCTRFDGCVHLPSVSASTPYGLWTRPYRPPSCLQCLPFHSYRSPVRPSLPTLSLEPPPPPSTLLVNSNRQLHISGKKIILLSFIYLGKIGHGEKRGSQTTSPQMGKGSTSSVRPLPYPGPPSNLRNKGSLYVSTSACSVEARSTNQLLSLPKSCWRLYLRWCACGHKHVSEARSSMLPEVVSSFSSLQPITVSIARHRSPPQRSVNRLKIPQTHKIGFSSEYRRSPEI